MQAPPVCANARAGAASPITATPITPDATAAALTIRFWNGGNLRIDA
jgi:hypothetical protein